MVQMKLKDFLFSLLALPLLMSFTCGPQSQGALDAFSSFETYTPELKECLEKTKKLCEGVVTDKSSENFNSVIGRAFEKVKNNKDFLDFYCQNFENGKISFNYDRKCNLTSLKKEIEQLRSCDFIPKNDHDADEALNICSQLLNDELQKPEYLTKEHKENFKKTLSSVVERFKQLYSSENGVKEILSKISLDTDFEYRLSSFVAGAREKNELSGCNSNWGEPASWCKGDYFILPGGRIFSEPANLELILAHEVGHIINHVNLPEKQFSAVTSKLKNCDHLGSQKLNEEQLRSETSADIHMARYHKEFMKDDVSTHFCKYDQKENYLSANYLHPFHRQSLINCYSLWQKD
jgi:hypothetical protein